MTHIAPTVTPRLGPALLREIPRFFGGLPAALQELLQNSLRAGASEVDFTLDGQTLTVTDNGAGLDDPQVILTAAESGWDSSVIEPAGVGALSALNPEFTVRVTYRSRDWQFSLTPEAFARGESVPVEVAAPVQGFQVTLQLNGQPDLLSLLEGRRGYAPVTVHLNGKVLAPKVPQGERLDTPAGALYLDSSPYGRTFQAVWEHFPVNADVLLNRVVQVGTPTAAALVQGRKVTLIIDPASGVRPKLPDRNALLDDAALHRAAVGVAAHLDAYVTRQLRAALPALGADVLPADVLLTAQYKFGPEVLAAFLRAEGYAQTSLAQPADVEVYLSDDGESDTSAGWTDDWVKPALGVAYAPEPSEQVTLALLRQQGYAVPYGTPDAPPETGLEVEAEQVRPFRNLTLWETDQRVMLGLAQTLTVNGVAVPVYVHVPYKPEDDQEAFLVLSGTPEEAETYLRAHQADVGGLLLLALLDTYDLRESDVADRDETVYATELGELILYTFIQTFFPERAQAQQEVERLRRMERQLNAAVDGLQTVQQAQPQLEVESAPCLARLRIEQARMEERLQNLMTQHRLA